MFSAGKLGSLDGGALIEINDSVIKSDTILMIYTPELHAHNSKIAAPDIYIHKNCVLDVEPNTFEGNIHLVSTYAEWDGIMSQYATITV